MGELLNAFEFTECKCPLSFYELRESKIKAEILKKTNQQSNQQFCDVSSKRSYFIYTNLTRMINIIKIGLWRKKDHPDPSKNQLGYEKSDHRIFFNVIFFLPSSLCMSQNKSSMFCVLNIYIYLEKYIKTGH